MKSLTLLLAYLMPVAVLAGEVRTWTDKTGTKQIRAELIRYVDGQVHLKMNANLYKLPAEALSAADRAYLKRLEAHKRPAGGPTTSVDGPPLQSQWRVTEQWKGNMPRPAPPEQPLVGAVREVAGLRVAECNVRSEARYQFQFSPDERHAYMLSAKGLGFLLRKIAAARGAVTQEIYLPFCRSFGLQTFVLTSEGLVVSSVEPSLGNPLTVVIDPETLAIQKGYQETAGQTLFGSAGSPVCWFTGLTKPETFTAVDIRRDGVVATLPVDQLVARIRAELPSAELDATFLLRLLRLSPDGRYLFTPRGVRIALEEGELRPNGCPNAEIVRGRGGNLVRFSPDGRLVAVPWCVEPELHIPVFAVDDLSKPVKRVPIEEPGTRLEFGLTDGKMLLVGPRGSNRVLTLLDSEGRVIRRHDIPGKNVRTDIRIDDLTIWRGSDRVFLYNSLRLYLADFSEQ